MSELTTTITPDQIDTGQHLWDAFDHMETEISARWLVRFAQHRGEGWQPFTSNEINRYYQTRGEFSHDFNFNRLIEPGTAYSIRTGPHQKGGGWITRDADGLLHFTDEFIQRCHGAAAKVPA